MLVFKHFIPISFQRRFLDKGYQKFCYFEYLTFYLVFKNDLKIFKKLKSNKFYKHFISPKIQLAQKHLQIHPFQSDPPNWKVIYNQFKNHSTSSCSQISVFLNFFIVNNNFSSLKISLLKKNHFNFNL